MCRRLIVLVSVVLVVALGSSASAANIYWLGATDSDWMIASNWGGTTTPPTSADWVDIRSDAWYGRYPVVSAGQTATAGTIRMNPGYGPETPTITVNGGTLNIYQEIYIGDSGGPADFILNSGTVTTGVGGTNNFTAVGSEGGNGQLHINGGTFNAGTLGLPKWWSTPGTGNVYIDGGFLNTAGIIMGGTGNAIEFTKNLPDGGGILVDVQDMNDTDFEAWQDTVQTWIDTGQIFSSASEVMVNFHSFDTARTTVMYSLIPEPATLALLSLGGGALFLRRRRK